MILVELFENIIELGLEKIGLYYSSYRGFVADRNDPKGLGRLKISIPEINGDYILDYWAWPKTFAGNGYGMRMIPKVNDLVWVEFEKGNPRKPIWQHGYHANNEVPEDLKNPDIYWLRTPSGLTLSLDDSTGIVNIFKNGNPTQFAVLSDVLVDKLQNIIGIMKDMKIPTTSGPQGILPIYITQLEELENTLDEIKSTNVKIS